MVCLNNRSRVSVAGFLAVLIATSSVGVSLCWADPYAYMEGKVIRLTPNKVILKDPRDGMQFSIDRAQVEKTLPKGKNLREGTEVRGHFDNVEFVPSQKK